MTQFRSTKIHGKTYHLDHLKPRRFDLTINTKTVGIEVHYSWHVFTEAITTENTPDLRYNHQGKSRAFSIERYEQSELLPSLIEKLDHCLVYHSGRENYFLSKTYLRFRIMFSLLHGPCAVGRMFTLFLMFCQRTQRNDRSTSPRL